MSANTAAAAAAQAATEPAAAQAPSAGNSSDIDSEVQSNKPLFLNFTAELAPFSASKKQKKKSNVYKVSGVNILNRNSVDSKTALERLQKRRENHNFVERRRRDNINHTITTLSTLIPYCTEDGVKLNKGSILHMAVEYIRDLQEINHTLAEENVRLGGSGCTQLPVRRHHHRDSLNSSSVDTTAPHSHDEDDYDEEDDDEEERTLAQSLATSPRVVTTSVAASASVPASTSTSTSTSGASIAGGAVAAAMAKKTSATKTSVAATPSAKSSRTRKKRSGSSSLATDASALPSEKRPMLLAPGTAAASPMLSTAVPSAAPSATTSPLALAASIVPPARTGSRQALISTLSAHPPALPPIGTIAAAAAAAAATVTPPHMHAVHLPPATSTTVAGAVRRPPAQSMPSSPSFRAHHRPAFGGSGARFGDHSSSSSSSNSAVAATGRQQLPAISSHPFFNSDVSSIRHHLQQQQQQQQHHLPSVLESLTMPVSAATSPYHRGSQHMSNMSGFEEPSMHLQPPAPPQRMHTAHSLQTTPLIRPQHDFGYGSVTREQPVELPSIEFAIGTPHGSPAMRQQR
ncbi:hypothetical protein GGI07_004167 [Coemansia sp. Benny D115]|nr:hypothetical protein GGI07_004167 [Coemansia sp. Benny D115]